MVKLLLCSAEVMDEPYSSLEKFIHKKNICPTASNYTSEVPYDAAICIVLLLFCILPNLLVFQVQELRKLLLSARGLDCLCSQQKYAKRKQALSTNEHQVLTIRDKSNMNK